jgi:hypothetical protein
VKFTPGASEGDRNCQFAQADGWCAKHPARLFQLFLHPKSIQPCKALKGYVSAKFESPACFSFSEVGNDLKICLRIGGKQPGIVTISAKPSRFFVFCGFCPCCSKLTKLAATTVSNCHSSRFYQCEPTRSRATAACSLVSKAKGHNDAA